MAIKLITIISLLLFPVYSWATVYWVSPTGEAAYSSCVGSTPLSGASACGISEIGNINSHVAAGDTIYFREGSYNTSATYTINPGANGTSDNKITYSGYESETVTLIGDGSNTNQYGVYLANDRIYIKITKLKLENFGQLVRLSGSYNEISYCELYHTGAGVYSSALSGIYIGTLTSGKAAIHNWIHHNTIHTIGNAECLEGADGITIGSNNVGDGDNNYNTIENNTIYHIGHTLTEDFSKYSVWRNNIVHNEGWKTFTGLRGTATGGSTTTLIDTSRNFVTDGVIVGNKLHAVESVSNAYGVGVVTSITTTTNTNDTLVYTVTGTVTFSAGVKYAISLNSCNLCPDPSGTLPGNDKYGHRCMSVTGDNETGQYSYILIEGNRSGHSAVNPTNNGADALTISARGNIVRYNALFGADGPGVNLKGYTCTVSGTCTGNNNTIYNNTIYKNGRYIVGGPNPPPYPVGIYQYAVTSIDNRIKNNIIYNNFNDYSWTTGKGFDGIYASSVKDNQIWGGNLCDVTDEDLGCISGDPKFINNSLADPTSAVLPNLNIESTSDAKDNGVPLTTVHADDTGSGTTLIVADALYFQDGTWGSDLTRTAGTMQGDWIAVGTVSNTAQITAIDYSTNTITLASGITRSSGQSVWLYKKSDGTQVLYGSAPDIGAYEYEGETPTATPWKNGISIGGRLIN